MWKLYFYDKPYKINQPNQHQKGGKGGKGARQTPLDSNNERGKRETDLEGAGGWGLSI